MPTITSSGGVLTVQHGDRITVGGEALIVKGYGAYMDGWGEPFELESPVTLSLERWQSIDGTSLQPVYAAAATVQAQVKNEKLDRRRNPADGPSMPETRKVLYLQEADTSASWPIVRLELQDPARGTMFPSMFTVKLRPYTVAAQTTTQQTLRLPAAAAPGSLRTLNPIFIDLATQIDYSTGAKVYRGDALIRIPRNEATEAELLGNTWIEITPIGGSAIRYRPNGPEGITPDQTYHWTVYLKRQP